MTDPTPDPWPCDVLVVGASKAAVAAANAAAHRGDTVVLLHHTAPQHPIAEGVRIAIGSPWGAFDPGELAAMIDGTPHFFRPRRIVLAQPRYPIPEPIPGWALPGVAGLDALDQVHGRVVLAGSGRGLLRATRRLLARGCTIVALPRTRPNLRRCEGTHRFEALLLDDGRRIRADWCVLHGGWAPETGLLRALGLPCRVEAPGILVPDDDANGATRPPPRWPIPNPAAFADDDIVCPCENVRARDVRAALAQGAASLPAVKRATRAGMGRCQARRCGMTLHALCGSAGEAQHFAPRAPLHPIPAGLLARPETVTAEPLAAPTPTRWLTIPPAIPPTHADIVVIGAGVLGLSAALHLACAGRDVLVLDRGEPGLGASTANAGSLHVQLLPEAFQSGSPGPLADALALGPASIALWREIAAAAGEPLGIRTEGGLILAADAADLAWLDRKSRFERSRGIETAILGPNELASRAPALSRRYAGAAFCPQEGQIDPLRGTAALLRLARQSGVRIAPGVAVHAMHPEGPAWRLHSPGGEIRAGQVLNAAGAHAPAIGALAGLALPLRAVVQQVIATAPAPPILRQLVAQAGIRLSLKQGDAGHLLIGGGWPGHLAPGGATSLDRRSIQGSLRAAIQALPALAGIDIVRAWTGLTIHLDRAPILSPTPGLPGLFHAATSNGYTLGPIAGQIIAEAMLARSNPPQTFQL